VGTSRDRTVLETGSVSSCRPIHCLTKIKRRKPNQAATPHSAFLIRRCPRNEIDSQAIESKGFDTMQRLFAGTPFDRPPVCERCAALETACVCPAPSSTPFRLDPRTQTATLRKEKRANGKWVSLVCGLDPQGNDLSALLSRLKTRCSSGGTFKEGRIELQGDHLVTIRAELTAIGYRVKG